MTYSALIVQAGTDARACARLEAAVDLAVRFEATLIGVGAETFPLAYASPEAAFIEGALIAEHRARIESGFGEARSIFERASAGRVQAVEWRSAYERPAEVMAREARAADLVVASASGGREDVYSHAAAADLVMTAGRPVLVVPQEARALRGRSVLIGWKDAREARRAVTDALPFLRLADEVGIVEVCDVRDQEAAFARTSDVARALERRGVKAHPHARLASEASPAADLSRIADEHEADLLVVGAYGHSRLREWIFGGVTRSLLDQKERFVLMSH
ncbi:MAG: universal stress protein [Pseudomonadota bacterium]|nr:universal stress protein [Pseudomonadota bacterium]